MKTRHDTMRLSFNGGAMKILHETKNTPSNGGTMKLYSNLTQNAPLTEVLLNLSKNKRSLLNGGKPNNL